MIKLYLPTCMLPSLLEFLHVSFCILFDALFSKLAYIYFRSEFCCLNSIPLDVHFGNDYLMIRFSVYSTIESCILNENHMFFTHHNVVYLVSIWIPSDITIFILVLLFSHWCSPCCSVTHFMWKMCWLNIAHFEMLILPAVLHYC